jgi:hypothetical protein
VNRPSHRRAFTLLETMLAAAIGALVVFACLGMFLLMNRTDRSMEARASDQAQLERLRFVMERTFSTLLMSDEPRTTHPGELSVATPVENLQAAMKDAKPGDPKAPGGAAGGAGTDRFGSNDRFGSTDRFGSDKSGGAGNQGGSSRFAPRSGAPGAIGDRTDKPGDAADPTKEGDSKNPAVRTPPPPRLILAADQVAQGTMTHTLAPGQPAQEALVPQRLEVVLFQSPVPTDNIDPVELALNSVRPKKTSSRFNNDSHSQTTPADRGSGVDRPPTQTEQDAAVETMTAPVRSVRGAFEVRPQPPRNSNGQMMQASFPQDLQQNITGLWQVWWVPLPRLDSTGVPEAPQDPADLAEGAIPQIPQPFLVASDLRYIKWTVFHERDRKPELSSTWSGDLPAYVEVEAQTAAGLAVNWMFEIDWAVGPEVPHPPTTPAGGAGAAGSTDKAGAGGGTDTKTGQPSGGGGATGAGGGTGATGGGK